MMARLVDSSYGKCGVRLTKVIRDGERHTLIELTVRIMLAGDFNRVYTHGDNSSCIPTDTMKNTVYALARSTAFDCPEAFAGVLADHFLRFAQVSRVELFIEEEPWKRITTESGPHPHAFTRGGSGLRTCRVRAERDGSRQTWAGVNGLEVVKTTRSGFAGFHKDRYTTLAETSDRVFATSVEASWEYSRSPRSFSAAFDAARSCILESFAGHDSASVQQTIFAIGGALLERLPEISRVSVSMPNRHRLPVNLQPFGLDNPNEIFAATSEPYGLISATLVRE
jgi:urate oxidase